MRAVLPPLLAAPALALAVAGCSVLGLGSEPETTATTSAQDSETIDVRRYIGPDYCPELRIPEGAQLMRRYERGHEDDPAYVVWQASIGDTARECLYDLTGNLTLKIGVSGRVIAGPKGGAGSVSVPLKLAVVKYKEAIIASEPVPLEITIPAQGSAVFTEVREIVVPSPGTSRDYLIFVGFDVGYWDPLSPTAAPAPVSAPVTEIEEPAPPPSTQPAQPRELPVPSGGFVLPSG